jgi:hypothetical protein
MAIICTVGEVVIPGAGTQGPKGDPGPQGLPGEAGHTPVKGVDYFDGLSGTKGEQGLQGYPGNDGAPGTPGVKGDKGDAGVKGDTGAPGSDASVTKVNVEAVLTGEIASHTHPGGSGEAEVIVVKVGDTANNTTTYADATGLSFTAKANIEYMIEGWIRYATSATTVGLKLSCAGPATPAFVSSLYNAALVTSGLSGGGGNNYNVGAATASAQATTDNLAMINILFKNGANQGTLTVRFAAETTGTITIKDGSLIRYRQVN